MRTSAPKTCTVRQRRLAAQWQRLAFKLAHVRFVAAKGAVPLEELQGVALLALTRAAAWFNLSRKCAFVTLASVAIWRDLDRFAADWLRSYGVGKCSLDGLCNVIPLFRRIPLQTGEYRCKTPNRHTVSITIPLIP